MKTIVNGIQWTIRVLFFLTIIVFIIVYARWFRLTPLVFTHVNIADDAFIVGIFLLAIYSFLLVKLAKLHENRYFLRGILLIVSSFLFLVNAIHAVVFYPVLQNTIECKGTLYFIAYSHPYGDLQWSYYQITKWRNLITYDSFLYGYAPAKGPAELVCDDKKSEVNFLQPFNVLDYSDGQNSRRYSHISTQLGNRIYVLSEKCSDNDPSYGCSNYMYTLYECESNYTGCNPLPVQYEDNSIASLYLELRSDKKSQEVNLFKSKSDNNEILIFTYGEHPRCYVAGCEILEETK